MSGINAATGAELDGYDHVLQSLQKIFTTFQGERIEQEYLGNPGLKLLGKLATHGTILVWCNILTLLVLLHEPRYRIIRFHNVDLTRGGVWDVVIDAEYLPFGHKNWIQAKTLISVDGRNVTVKRAG